MSQIIAPGCYSRMVCDVPQDAGGVATGLLNLELYLSDYSPLLALGVPFLEYLLMNYLPGFRTVD